MTFWKVMRLSSWKRTRTATTKSHKFLNSLKIDRQINSVAERNAIVSLMDSQYDEMISPEVAYKEKPVHSSFCMFNDDVVVWLSIVSLILSVYAFYLTYCSIFIAFRSVFGWINVPRKQFKILSAHVWKFSLLLQVLQKSAESN